MVLTKFSIAYREMEETGNLNSGLFFYIFKFATDIKKEGSLSLVHRLAAYKAIKELSSDKGYPVDKLCKYLNITRSAYLV